MFAVGTYEEIEAVEQCVENEEIVVFLFVKPTNPEALHIIKEFEYIHYNSEKYCSVYAIGYSNDFEKAQDASYRVVDETSPNCWYFSMRAFTDFKRKLEKRIDWEYSGEVEVLVLQKNLSKQQSLDFSDYVAIDINKGIREGYIDSFQRFMESLIRSAQTKTTAKQAIKDVSRKRTNIRTLLESAVKMCKGNSLPLEKIIKDKLFYRTANRTTEIK